MSETYADGLREELRGYEARGLEERAEQVRAEIARATGDPMPAKKSAPKRAK